MTPSEFSNQFDILYDNITSNQAPGLDDYEKSVFLTKAQEELVKDYFNPINNKLGQGFDGSTKRQYDFSTIVKTVELRAIPQELLQSNGTYNSAIDPRSRLYVVPKNYYLEVNNTVVLNDGKILAGTSITYAQYLNYLNTPYQLPSKHIFWKLMRDMIANDELFEKKNYYIIKDAKVDNFITLLVPVDLAVVLESGEKTNVEYDAADPSLILTYKMPGLEPDSDDSIDGNLTSLRKALENAKVPGVSIISWSASGWTAIDGVLQYNKYYIIESSNCCEIILNPAYNVQKNILRYIKRPNPIILVNLDDGFTIHGKSTQTPCELPEATHEEILQRAVELAKVAYTGSAGDIMSAGSVSSTDIGIIPSSNSK